MGALLLLLPVAVGAGIMFAAAAPPSRYLVQIVVGAVGLGSVGVGIGAGAGTVEGGSGIARRRRVRKRVSL